QVRHVHVDLVGHIFGISHYVKRILFADKCAALQDAGRLSDETSRNFHLDLPLLGYPEEVGMQDDFTDRMELYVLEDSLALLTFNVKVDKVRLVGVDQVSEQDHRRIEMDLVAATVQYT